MRIELPQCGFKQCIILGRPKKYNVEQGMIT